MHPILFDIFGFPVRTYGMAMATAFIINIFLVYRRAPVEGQDREISLNTCLWIVIGTLVGGRVLFAITQWNDFATEPKKLLSFWEGGLVFYGGFIGSYMAGTGYIQWVNLPKKQRRQYLLMMFGLAFFIGYFLSAFKAFSSEPITASVLGFEAGWIQFLQNPDVAGGFFHWLFFPNYGLYHCVGFIIAFFTTLSYWAWRTRADEKPYAMMPILDLLSPYVGFGLAIHRAFGCFLNGCCYGRPTDAPWGVQFPLEHHGTQFYGAAVHLHPSQLYEAMNGLSIFFILLWFRKRKRNNGEVTAWLLIIYAINRYIIEYFRGDALREFVGAGWAAPVWMAAFAGYVLLLLGILIFFRSKGISSGNAPQDDPKKVFGGFAALMALFFVVTYFFEIFRINPTLARVGPISTSQFIGYLTLAVGWAIYTGSHYLGKKAKPLAS